MGFHPTAPTGEAKPHPTRLPNAAAIGFPAHGTYEFPSSAIMKGRSLRMRATGLVRGICRAAASAGNDLAIARLNF